MEVILESVIRAIVSFILLLVVTFFIGKHINSHKNYYSFALSITVGSIIANMAFEVKLNFSGMLASFLTVVLIYYILLSFSSKNRVLRTWLSGSPTVVIENGKILEENMKKIKFSLDTLNQHLREQGIFNINEVDYALLEISGELSILKKKSYQPLTQNDLSIRVESTNLPIELIMDGEIIYKNLTPRYNQGWLLSEINKRKMKVEDIYYAVLNSNDFLFIDQYRDNLTTPSDIE